MEKIKYFIDDIANDDGEDFKKLLNPKKDYQNYKNEFFDHISHNYRHFAKTNNINRDWDTNEKNRNHINRLFNQFAQHIINKDFGEERQL